MDEEFLRQFREEREKMREARLALRKEIAKSKELTREAQRILDRRAEKTPQAATDRA